VIVVDTFALMAILLREPLAEACETALVSSGPLAISAGTIAEALIVAGARKLGFQMATLIDRLDFEVEPVTLENARSVVKAYEVWGKGRHAGRLIFGDCFAYSLAHERACPLLFVGDDFSKTDIEVALDRRG